MAHEKKPAGPVKLRPYTVANRPTANSENESSIIYVRNGDGGNPCLAVSNGTAWLRCVLGAEVAAS